MSTGKDLEAVVRLARERLDEKVDPHAMRVGEHRLVRAWKPARFERSYAPWALAALTVLVGGGVLARRAWSPPPALTFDVEGVAAQGAALDTPEGSHNGNVLFSDGTRLSLAPGSSTRVEERTANGARLALEKGGVHCDVVPRPNARWTIDAGPFSIAVHGTVFDVAWVPRASSLDVTLTRGAVTVTGPTLGEGVALRPGQRLRVRGDVVTTELADAPPAEPAATASAPSDLGDDPESDTASDDESAQPLGSSSKRRGAAPSPSWEKMTASGETVEVLRQARAAGLARSLSTRPAADLLALGDAARYERQNEIAKRAYTRLRARFTASREAADAAFFLGRILESTDARGASAWYRRYLDERPGGAYAAEALGREMIMAKHYDEAEAKSLGGQYLRQYPRGAFANAARGMESSR